MNFNYIKWIYVKVEKEENTGSHHHHVQHSNRNLHKFYTYWVAYRSPILQSDLWTALSALSESRYTILWWYDVNELQVCFYWFHFRAGWEAINKVNNLWRWTACRVCVRVCGGCQLSYRRPGKLPWLLALAQVTQPSVMIGNHTALMASYPSPFGILASKIPTEHCPPLRLDKGSGVIGWLIASCRLCFFSLIAGWVRDVWCRHALKMFCPSLNGVFAHAAHLQKD